MRSYSHFICGDWHEPVSTAFLDSVDPSSGAVWCRIARGCAEDVAVAVSDAYRAYRDVWGCSSPQRRAATLHGLADVLEARFEELIVAEVRDNGKRIAEVHGQLTGLHSWYRYFADQALTIQSHPFENGLPGVENEARYEPYGVIAAITPWNSPLMIAAWKIAPALAAGNTVVIKPSEHASASTLEFARLAAEAGIPAGVINVVTGLGHEVGEPLVRHPLVRKVTFTGSDFGGRKVAEAAAAGVKPVTLELGGKSPQLVFADCDLDATVNGILSGIFLSNGQTCVAGSRVIVEASIHNELVKRIAAKTKTLKVGDPMDVATEIAPLANAPHLDKVLSMIATARTEGATCILGGERLHPEACPNGYFVAPTLFTNVTPEMELWQQEVFGPVLAVTKFTGEAQALALANDTDYGLAAGVWTSDPERGRRLAAGIEAGTVYVNHYRSVSPGSPIGGYKHSGYGRELGPDAVKDFLQTKSVWVGNAPCADPFPRSIS